MTTIIIFLLLTLINTFTTAIDPLCAAVCRCENFEDEGLFKADCSRVGLPIVPPVDDWPEKVTHMDLSTNNITALDTELSHDTLQVLDLSNNKIHSVTQSAFGGLKSLKYLNLASNNIKKFEDNGFYGLDHLKSLNLSSNGLVTLPDNLFYNFIGLQELSLADNPLVHIEPLHFNRMIALRWLDLSNIDAYSLEANMFHTTGQLEFLDLSGNDFHGVPTEALRSAKNIKHLRLSDNPFDFIDKKSFIKLASLEVLELNTMDFLTRVMTGSFSDLQNLHTLEMKYNRYLTTIDPLAFDGLFNDSRPVLQELDLEGNQISNIDQNMVSCARMRKFNVQKNPLMCDCHLKWIRKCDIQMIYAADLKCGGPPKVANYLITSLDDKDFVCDKMMATSLGDDSSHHTHVVRTVTIGIAAGFMVVIAFGLALIFKWKDIKTWYRYNKKGPGAVYYVRARKNPREI